MAFKNIHAPRGSLFIGLLFLSILIFDPFGIIPQSLAKSLNFAFRSVFRPVLEVGRKFSIDPIRMAQNPELVVEKDQYNQLWKNYKNLEAKMTEVERENLFLSRVRKQYGLSESGLLMARVNTLLLTSRHEAIISEGTLASVKAGQIVLSADKNSVIGTVKDATEKMARVALITDSTHGIEVRIRRDGTQLDIPAQMFGDGKERLSDRILSPKIRMCASAIRSMRHPERQAGCAGGYRRSPAGQSQRPGPADLGYSCSSH
jgi:cell shape-determining protein MreC